MTAMSSLTPLMVLLGACAGVGLVFILREFLPQQARLDDALTRLDTNPVSANRRHVEVGDNNRQVRIGHWLERLLPAQLRSHLLGPDLALMQRSSADFLGEKALTALVGLMLPLVFTLTVSIAGSVIGGGIGGGSGGSDGGGLQLPVLLPAGASLVMAVGGFLLPDAQLRQRATMARAEFSRAVGAYLELVALERRAASGTTQALERAAEISDSWVFRRIREELRLARISGVPAWDNLQDLAREIRVNELSDLADIMRLAGTQNAAVADNLHARSRSLRNALLNREKAAANADGERAVIPVAALGLIFVALLAIPAAIQITG